MNIHQMMSALLLVLQSCALALPSGTRTSDSDKPGQQRSSSKSAQRSEHSSSLSSSSSKSSLLPSTSLPSALVAESAETGLVQIKKTPIPQLKKKKRQSKRTGLKARRKNRLSRKIEQENLATTHNDVSGSAPVSIRRQSDLHATSSNAPRRSKNRLTPNKRRRNRKRCRKNRKNRKNNKKNKKRHMRRTKGCKGKKSKRKNVKKNKQKRRSRRHKTHKVENTTEDEVETRENTTEDEVETRENTTEDEVETRELGTQVRPSASTWAPTSLNLHAGYRASVSLSHKREKEKKMTVLKTLLKLGTKPLQKRSPESHDS